MNSQLIKLLCLFMAFTFSNQLIAQETFGIKGTVTDSLNVNIESGNVIVLSPSDSTVIKGTHFWEGDFSLLGLETKEVLLKFTSSGFTTLFQPITLSPDSSGVHDLGVIVLKSSVQDIGAMSVVYHKPMFEREPGKLIVNVEGTSLALKGTVWDLLKSAPNVTVRQESVIVAGKGPAVVYMDGQRVASLEILKSMPSILINSIEIIDNPSAKYDAEGYAVIEIITKKGAMDGVRGNIGLRGMKRTEVQTAYWANINVRKKWFSMQLSGYQYAGDLIEEEDYYRELYGATPINMFNDIDRVNKHKFWTGVYLNTDYRLDSLSTLFVNYIFEKKNNDITAVNSNRIFENGLFAGDLNSNSLAKHRRFTNSITAGYTRDLDTLGSDIRVAGQFTNFSSSSNTEISQITNFGTPTTDLFQSLNDNSINLFSGKFDYTKKFKKDMALSLGVKNALVSNASGLNFQYQENGNWVEDSTLRSEFDFSENIAASYAELTGREKKLSYSAGIRYEWTVSQGVSLLTGDELFDRNYQNVFPNVQLNYDITPDLILGASYVNRIQRPSFQDLNPFVDFIDSLSSFRGNPNLLPAISHSAELSLVFMEYASIKLGYAKTKDPIFLTVEQNLGTNSFSAIEKNIDSREVYSLDLVIPYEWPWFTTFNAIGYAWNEYTYFDQDALLLSNEPTFYISLYNEFRFKNLFNMELTYDYVSPGSQGFFIAKPYQSFGGSISRKFFDDKLNVQFRVFDALFQEIERAESNFNSFYVNYKSRSDSRSFMLTLTWNFGEIGNARMKGSNVDGEERDRIKD